MGVPIPPVSVEYLTHWLREHREESTEEALRGRLLEAGHPPADVEAAFARLHAEGLVLPDAAPPPLPLPTAGSRLLEAAPRPSSAAKRDHGGSRLPRWGWVTWALVVWNSLVTLFVAGILYVTETGGVVVECEGCNSSDFFVFAFSFFVLLSSLVYFWLLGLVVLALVWLKRQPTGQRRIGWAIAYLVAFSLFSHILSAHINTLADPPLWVRLIALNMADLSPLVAFIVLATVFYQLAFASRRARKT